MVHGECGPLVPLKCVCHGPSEGLCCGSLQSWGDLIRPDTPGREKVYQGSDDSGVFRESGDLILEDSGPERVARVLDVVKP